jgi:hypothetical protein
MAYAFDTLGYSKRLRDNGVPQAQAEAHAEAARDFIMAQLVTQQDLQAAVALLDTKLMLLDTKLDTLSLRLTVRLGVMLVVAIGLLASILKLVP